MHTVKNQVRAIVGAGAAGASGLACAAAQDYSGVATALSTELTAAITTALPIGGLVMGVFLAWRVIKRMTKG